MPLAQINPGQLRDVWSPYFKLTSFFYQVPGYHNISHHFLSRFKFYVYSAYYDRRDKRYVRIIAATKTRGPERVWCRLFYPRATANRSGVYVSLTVLAKIKVIRENWNLKYSACFVLCPLRKEIGPPEVVSIVSRLRADPAHLLRVRNTDQDPDFANRSATDIPKKMAVCVKPFHYHYDQSLNILEFLELYSIMGIDHFFMYKHTLGEHVSCLLKDYEASGRLTMMPWDLNMLSQKEIRTECQFAAFNDCLYRAMYRYSHVALVDLDEFIIPNHNYTLFDMLKWLQKRLNTWSTGSFSFQNAFFYLQWGDDPSVYNTIDRVETGLITSRKTRRRAKLHPHKQRSKYICRPEVVVEAGNHFVWEFIPGHGTLNVPSDAAILHHYRVCEFGGDDCIKTTSAVDQTAYKYKPELIERVGRKYNTMKDVCQLPDLPPLPTPPPVKKKKKLIIVNKSKLDNGKIKQVI
ncbi:beta-1,4-galactosyltransferase galt-1-like [Ctenocephalides felis]|uniref:beta-1,4-galactosyltransferase galt-1-like n=1 Tax=Ctenocephalides felis TaxID=7515 RepID=UPI000E6E16B4|nr:beta-1,4-galactosyltransferase galt-1-like [Ctenocephalides felis]